MFVGMIKSVMSELVMNPYISSKKNYYAAQYPGLRTTKNTFNTLKNTLHFTYLADLFNQAPSSHVAINAQRNIGHVDQYIIQLNGLEQCRVKTLAHGIMLQHNIQTRQ